MNMPYFVGVEFATADPTKFSAKCANCTDLAWVDHKYFNAAEEELDSVYTACTRTQIDIYPDFDYWSFGGDIYITSDITSDIRMSVQMAPDIPAEYGGKVDVTTLLNLKFLKGPFSFSSNPAMFTKYAASGGTKLRFNFYHPVETYEDIMLLMRWVKA